MHCWPYHFVSYHERAMNTLWVLTLMEKKLGYLMEAVDKTVKWTRGKGMNEMENEMKRIRGRTEKI